MGSCLYGRAVTVCTKHSAIKAVLEMSNLTGKHTRVFESGIAKIQMVNCEAQQPTPQLYALMNHLSLGTCVKFPLRRAWVM